MRISLCMTLLVVATVAVACSASACSSSSGTPNHCCNLEAHGFDADDSTSIRWLRAQIDTPEFHATLRCDPRHELTFDTIGRKMSHAGCWGRIIRINGVSFEMLTRGQFIELMQRRHCFPF
jgi:hypothetical protein